AAGVLADRLGAGRVVRAGLFLSLLCFLAFAIVPSFAALLVVRVRQGVSGGLIYGAAPALVTLALPPSRHGWGLGWASFGLGVGLGLSPLVGGFLVEAFGWKGVFLYRVPVAAAIIALAVWMREPRRGSAATWRMVVPADILRWPVIHAGALAFLANFAQFSVWLLAPFYLVTERGLSAAVGGLLFMLTPLATAAAAPLSGRATDRWGRRGAAPRPPARPRARGASGRARGLSRPRGARVWRTLPKYVIIGKMRDMTRACPAASTRETGLDSPVMVT